MSLTGFLSYSRVNWQQSPSKSTPLSAANLNVMDAGIKNNNDMISNIRDEITQLNGNIDVKNSFCKNIASVDGTLEGYGYNYCYYNKSTKTGILYYASKIETPDSAQNNFTGYYNIETVLENMGISFSKILESNYTPYDATGVVRAKLIGYGTTLLYSSASQHYAFARYYTKDGNKGAWATSEFQKGDYITGSLIFSQVLDTALVIAPLYLILSLFSCRMKIRHKVLTKITKEDVRYFLIEHDELQEAIHKVGSAT